MFGKAKFKNSKIWKILNPGFQWLEEPKFRIPMFGKAKLKNSSAEKTQNQEFQSLKIEN